MAKQRPQKVLRVGIFQEERSIEERSLEKREPVTIGQTLSNTFVIPTSAMPRTFTLFDVDSQGRYILRFTNKMRGRLSVSGEMIDLSQSQTSKRVRKVGESGHIVLLNETARGAITIGSTRILFNFVDSEGAEKTGAEKTGAEKTGAAKTGAAKKRPTKEKKPTAQAQRAFMKSIRATSPRALLALIGPTFIPAVAFSFILQATPLGYVIKKDWPTAKTYSNIEAPKLENLSMCKAPDEKKEEIVEEKKDKDEVEVVAKLEAPDTPQPEQPKKPRRQVKTSRSKSRMTRSKSAAGRTRQRSRGAAAGQKLVNQALGGFDMGGMMPDAGRAAHSLDAALAATGTGTGDGTGTGAAGLGDGPGGDGGGPGILGEGDGGGSVVGGGGPEEKTAPKRKAVKINVKGSKTNFGKKPPAANDRQAIDKAFKRYRGQIANCYKRFTMKGGSYKGKIAVEIRIKKGGDVHSVKVGTASAPSELLRCIEGKINKWKFRGVSKTTAVRKSWVFGN